MGATAMFPPKGPNHYGQQPPYGGQQPYGQIVRLCEGSGCFLLLLDADSLLIIICVPSALAGMFSLFQPSSTGFAAPTAAGGTDAGRFGARAGQGAAAQYGGPYASVYGTQQVFNYNCFVLF